MRARKHNSGDRRFLSDATSTFEEVSVIETVRLTVRMPKELRDQIEQIARETDRSPSAEARRALRAHVALHRSRGGDAA